MRIGKKSIPVLGNMPTIQDGSLKIKSNLNKTELYILFTLAFLTLFFGFYPEPLFVTIDVSVNNLIEKSSFDFDGIDQILVDGTGRIANLLGRTFKTVQTGKLQNYVLYVTAGVIIIMVIQSF